MWLPHQLTWLYKLSSLQNIFLNKVSLCSPGGPGTHYVGKAGLEFTEVHPCLYLPSAGTKGMCHYSWKTWIHYWYLGACLWGHFQTGLTEERKLAMSVMDTITLARGPDQSKTKKWESLMNAAFLLCFWLSPGSKQLPLTPTTISASSSHQHPPLLRWTISPLTMNQKKSSLKLFLASYWPQWQEKLSVSEQRHELRQTLLS